MKRRQQKSRQTRSLRERSNIAFGAKKEKGLLETIQDLKKQNKPAELAAMKIVLEEEKKWLTPLLIMFNFMNERMQYVEQCLAAIDKN